MNTMSREPGYPLGHDSYATLDGDPDPPKEDSMEMIVFGFGAMTILVLFFGIVVAHLMGKFVEEDSDKIIQNARPKDTKDTYGTTHRQIPQQIQSSLPSHRTQPRTYVNKRQTPPIRTRKV